MNFTTVDALPSWNDGEAKQAVLAFVARVTKEASPDFLTPAERIAVLDNDALARAADPVPGRVTARANP